MYLKDINSLNRSRDWDSYDAPPLYPAAFLLAIGIVEYFGLKPDRVIPDPIGSVDIYFDSPNRLDEPCDVAYINVFSDGHIEFFEVFQGEPCRTNAVPYSEAWGNYLRLDSEFLTPEAEEYIRSFPLKRYYYET